MIIRTERTILRPWCVDDFEPFAELNQDARVMEYFAAMPSRQESHALAEQFMAKLESQGWGLWAVSVPGVASFIGFIGLAVPAFEAHFTPAVEVGWRLAYPFWGRGYATEGALAVLKHGFDALSLDEIVSFTTESNMRSRHVMQKIGMHRNPKDDFNHPKLSREHPLIRHVLYRITRAEWSANTGS